MTNKFSHFKRKKTNSKPKKPIVINSRKFKGKELPKYEIWVDGSALTNPGPGAYGTIILQENKEVIRLSEGYFLTTNNRQELRAVVKGLEYFEEPVDITFFTDSQYVKMGCESWLWNWSRNNWRNHLGYPVKNEDLFKRAHLGLQQHRVSFVKVKGHSGVYYNEEADKLAGETALKPTKEDSGYSPD